MALRVFGAGCARTGTTTFREAHDLLGFGPCQHARSFYASAPLRKLWARRARNEAVNWDDVFEGYSSVVGWPASCYWREITNHYPNAKVILTVRSADSWYASMQSTLVRLWAEHEDVRRHFEATGELPPKYRLPPDELEGTPADAYFLDLYDIHKGLRAPFEGNFDFDTMRKVFDRHNADVRAAFGSDRLLVFEAKHGWGPLCEFLGTPVPAVPFPTSNAPNEFAKQHKWES